MPSPIRRVVTGHDAEGKAIVLLDTAAPNVRVREATGIASTLLWVTDESPADVSGEADRAARTIGVAPPERGSVFRVVDFPPLKAGSTVEHAAVLKEMGLGAAGAPARSPFMHRTRSVDYALILTGEIDMLLDDSSVHLKAGDVLIQQGTNHAWENHGTAVCRIAFVLIDAMRPHQWQGDETGH